MTGSVTARAWNVHMPTCLPSDDHKSTTVASLTLGSPTCFFGVTDLPTAFTWLLQGAAIPLEMTPLATTEAGVSFSLGFTIRRHLLPLYHILYRIVFLHDRFREFLLLHKNLLPLLVLLHRLAALDQNFFLRHQLLLQFPRLSLLLCHT